MTGLPKNVDDLLSRLGEDSRAELDLVQQLGSAIRHADDRLLKEVRSVTLMHEMRREAIFEELQHLAGRLCALPARDPLREAIREPREQRQVVNQPAPPNLEPVAYEAAPVARAGDWRQAAQRIDEELEDYFGGPAPRH